MRRGLPALLCAGVLVCAVPAAATSPQLALMPGQAFRVAGTRVGCWVVGPAASPSVACGLWGRTTRIIPGTISTRAGDDAVEVYQRPLKGELSLLRELPQPPPSAPPPATPPATPEPSRTRTLFAGDTATLAGTDLFCAVVRRGGLGARCSRRDPATGQLVAASALVTLTETSVLAARVNSRGIPSTAFYQRQPFVPTAAAVAGGLRALARAEGRLAGLRRAYHGTLRGYRAARKGFRAIETDLRHDRYIAACLKFMPLLYSGFYLPPGSVARGQGHRYLASVRRIERALCG
jgi:hypothetical protein